MNSPARAPPPGGVPPSVGPGDGVQTLFTHRCVPQGPASSSRSELASPFGSLRSSLMGTPFISLLRVGRASPARAPPPGGVPAAPGPEDAAWMLSIDGAYHRALRHPREASLTPQAPTPSREWIQRYSRRAAQGACRRPRGIGYILGVFWYFLSLVTKSTTFPFPRR